MYPTLQLKKDKEKSVLRFHPWIFSGAIQSDVSKLQDGCVVRVIADNQKFLCVGHFYQGSIAVKILSFKDVLIDELYWKDKIRAAIQLRTQLGWVTNKKTSCFRLIHGEGDNLPGLIIDIYNNTAVVQCHTVGMHSAIPIIAQTLQEELPTIKHCYDKSKEFLPKEYAINIQNSYLFGNETEIIIREYENQFYIDVAKGQKTGFFIDQRENRNLLAKYCANKSVLNTFCYSGGFSVYALNNKCSTITSVDVSKTAITLTEQNIALNRTDSNKHIPHTAICADVLEFFKTNTDKFDIVILDPPAFAKAIAKRHNAIQAYKRINIEALKRVQSGGLLFTFSCSQVVTQDLFYATVMSAAIEAQREVKIIHYLSQANCHPINIFHPESNYLKGLVLYVG